MKFCLQNAITISIPGPPVALGAAIVIIIAAYTTISLVKKRGRLRLPPGPPSEPLLGHYRVVPLDAAFKQYNEWAKEYSTVLQWVTPSSVNTANLR
jgi:hypothetical protein